MTANAIEVRHVSKVYRRFGRRRQFATLKSALLSGSFVSRSAPDETFQALHDVSFDVAAGRTLRHHRAQRIGQEHDAQARRRHHASRRAGR